VNILDERKIPEDGVTITDRRCVAAKGVERNAQLVREGMSARRKER